MRSKFPPELEVYHLTKNNEWELRPIDTKNMIPTGFAMKPPGALWMSPVDSEYGWKEWCEENEYIKYPEYKTEVRMTIDTTRLYIINSLYDASIMPWKEFGPRLHGLDIEELHESGFTGIWLTVKGENQTRLVDEYSFYGWDCESICIWDSGIVKEITTNEISGIMEEE